jgi:hypothetical protein
MYDLLSVYKKLQLSPEEKKMLNSLVRTAASLSLCFPLAVTALAGRSIPVENASFESPLVDPNGFSAVPFVDGWIEIDVDIDGGTNTGVFANPAEGSPGRLVNADGDQLAFLGSATGNGLEQDLIDTYRVGRDYTLTAAVGISGMFPPSVTEPNDSLELVLYYWDGDQTIDVASQSIDAAGLSSTELKDVSLFLSRVQAGAAFATKRIGVALHAAGAPGGFWDIDNVRLTESPPTPIYIENASFEAPAIDPDAFPAVPFVDAWVEIDVDLEGSSNTGVFANTPGGSPDHVVNAQGDQLAFLGSGTGNALEQDLVDTYKPDHEYMLAVSVGVSALFPPSIAEPADTLELALYYYDDVNEPVDIVCRAIEATGLTTTQLTDFSLFLPRVQEEALFATKKIGVALRSVGLPGGFWDIDNVRLIETIPEPVPIENASFETPVIDPNGFPAVPQIDKWIETDVDTLSSANTGVFANTAEESWDHKTDAHGQQLAFLGSETGNAMEQDLAAVYKTGYDYRLTVAVGVSSRFAPSTEEPADLLELALLYRDGDEILNVMSQTIDATGLSDKHSTDISLRLATVQPDDAWAEMPISVALRSLGMAGGFWVLDDVRLAESLFDPIP